MHPRRSPQGNHANDGPLTSTAHNQFPGRKFHGGRATQPRWAALFCRPPRRRQCRDQGRKQWRERPRCARCKWPRACPEGSLTPWLSVCRRSSERLRSLAESPRIRSRCAHGTERRSSRQFGPARAGNPGPRTAPVAHAMTHTDAALVVAHFEARCVNAMATLDALAITESMFDLCSAPCKARRFAPPAQCARPAGLDGACAQTDFGHYVMAGDILVQQISESADTFVQSMFKMLPVHGLYRFGLTLPALTCLGTRTVQLSIQLRGRSVQQVARLSPRKRMAAIKTSLAQQLERVRRAFPGLEFTPRGNTRASWTIDVKARADQVIDLARRREVAALFVDSIKGRRARTQRRSRRWFCVWAVLAVQIEGRRKGHVTLEDRLVLVKALSMNEADSSVRRQCAQETEPRVNPNGELVRWALVSVQDVFELFDDAINPRGTDVYSRLRRALMRPEFIWSSRATIRSRQRAHEGKR